MQLHTVGGYNEVGKNMTVLELDEDAFIFDEGFYLPAIVGIAERDKIMTEQHLKAIHAIPNDHAIEKIRHKVRAQFVGHAHLDHVGAVPFISDRYNAPIYATPFTVAVLQALLKDTDSVLRNKIRAVEPNSHVYIQGKNQKYKVDFINVTHSTLQSSFIAVHTKQGVVLYATDFKIDEHPIMGHTTNLQKLREIAKEGVRAIIIDSLYSGSDRKTPSEKVARELLEEVMLSANRNSGMIVTTFSSHIARLKSIVDFGKKIGREILFLGRSLDKYTAAANQVHMAPFLNSVHKARFSKQVEKMLHKVHENRKKYLVVCTGHQGEPGSILERISRNQLPIRLDSNYNVLFSSSVIPTPINKENSAAMESRLTKHRARIFRELHVSGHAGREDLRDVIGLLQPQHIIPCHGDHTKIGPMIELAEEMGYKSGKTCHLMKNGEVLKL